MEPTDPAEPFSLPLPEATPETTPETTPDARPEMPRQTANWHAHVAGARARHAATAAGADPAAVASLEAAGRAPARIGPFELPDLTVVTFWVAGDLARKWPEMNTGIKGQVLSLITFLEPDLVRECLLADDQARLDARAYEIARMLTPEDYIAAARHIGEAMARMEALGGSRDDSPDAPAGKPPAGSSATGSPA